MNQSVFMQDHVRNRVEVVMDEKTTSTDFRNIGLGGVLGAVAIVFAHALIGI